MLNRFPNIHPRVRRFQMAPPVDTINTLDGSTNKIWTIRGRITILWTTSYRDSKDVDRIQLIIMDELGDIIQGMITKKNVAKFSPFIKEGGLYSFGLNIPLHSFTFVDFRDINCNVFDHDSAIDVIGYITKFSPLQADVNDSSSPAKLDFTLENKVLTWRELRGVTFPILTRKSWSAQLSLS